MEKLFEYINLQVAYPDNIQPCLLREGMALQEEWMYFAEPVNGKSASFTIPGYLNNVVFRCIQ